MCGVNAEISTQIMERAFDYLDAPVKRVSGVDVPMPYAKNLEALVIPDVARVVAAVREVAYLD
jgi:pyruvate dehydrogenase E1 component beta subunit